MIDEDFAAVALGVGLLVGGTAAPVPVHVPIGRPARRVGQACRATRHAERQIDLPEYRVGVTAAEIIAGGLGRRRQGKRGCAGKSRRG